MQVLALHHFFDGECRDDVQRDAGVVAFAMTRRAFDDGIVIADAGLLRRLRDIVDIGAERDHRLAFAPTGDPGGRDAGVVALDFETILFEDPAQILRMVSNS